MVDLNKFRLDQLNIAVQFFYFNLKSTIEKRKIHFRLQCTRRGKILADVVFLEELFQINFRKFRT